MSRSLTRLNVSLTLGTGAFAKGIRAADKGLQGFSRRIGNIAKRILSPLNLIGATLSTGAFAYGIKRAMTHIDGLAKSADALGMTTTALAGLQHAADLSGISTEKLNRFMSRSNRLLGEAAMGFGSAAQWIERMGLEVETLQNMDPGERFHEYSRAIRSMSSHTERAAASAALFGDRQGVLLPLLMENRVGLEDAARQADALGLSLSRVDAAQVEAANDAITRIRGAFAGIFRTIAVRLAPFVEYFADSMSDMAVSVGGVGEVVDRVISFAIRGVARVIDAWQGMRLLWTWAARGFYGLAETITNAIQHIVRGATWWADKFGAAFSVIKLSFRAVIEFVQYGWSVMREAVARSVAFVVRQMSRLMHQVAAGMMRIKGMMDEALAIQSAAFDLHRRAGEMARGAREDTQQSAAAMDQTAEEIADQWDRLFGHTEMRGSEFVDNLSDEFGHLREAAQDSIFDQLSQERVSERFEATIQQIQHESRLRAEHRAEEIELAREHDEQLEVMAADAAERQQSIITNAWQEGMEERTRLSNMHWTTQASHAISQIEAITRGVASSNKAMFRINQIAGAANAAINTAEGVTKALAAYPPPLSFAMAGLQAAAGAAQIAAIKSQSFGGGASAPSVAGSGGGVPDQTGPNSGTGPGADRAGIPRQAGTIVLPRDVAIDPVRLAEAINQARRDGFVFDGAELR